MRADKNVKKATITLVNTAMFKSIFWGSSQSLREKFIEDLLAIQNRKQIMETMLSHEDYKELAFKTYVDSLISDV